jgi:hypothetical protein
VNTVIKPQAPTNWVLLDSNNKISKEEPTPEVGVLKPKLHAGGNEFQTTNIVENNL